MMELKVILILNKQSKNKTKQILISLCTFEFKVCFNITYATNVLIGELIWNSNNKKTEVVAVFGYEDHCIKIMQAL